jgi:uncharacterized repeat protein (TIGR03847 family)
MSDSFEFREVTHFTAGAIGQPGQRVFYLQVGDGLDLITVKLEKQQVEALARFLRGVLDDLPAEGVAAESIPLVEPAQPRWTVGQIAVGIDESASKVVLVIEEISADVDEDDDDEILGSEPDLGRIQAHVGVALAAGFVAASDALMSQGRPPCRLCGQPVDPAGHACPRLN